MGFAVLVVTFGATSASTILTMDRLHQAIRITHAGYLQLALAGNDLDTKQENLRSYLREELENEKDLLWARRRVAKFTTARNNVLETTESILRDVRQIDGVKDSQFASTTALVERMRALVNETRPLYAKLDEDPPIKSDTPPSDQQKSVQRDLDRLERRIAAIDREIKRHETQMLLKLSEQLDVVSRKTWLFTLLWGASAVLLGVFMTIGARVMLRPLQRLREAANRIAGGDYEHRISVAGPREISELAREFNVMGQAIQEHARELVQTERLATAGKMAVVITHEVRNPLSSIGLNTELLEEEMGDLPEDKRDEAQKLCRAINAEVDRLTDITEGYLQLAGLPTPKLHEEALEPIIDNLVSFVREQLRSQGVTIELDLPSKSCGLRLDEGQIRQALLNLLRNAADALQDTGGGVVTISLVHHPQESVLTLSDNGPGIPEDLMDSVFEAFVSTKSAGTGLGLALTHQIIQSHGGSISVSNSDSGGAVFQITLPRSI